MTGRKSRETAAELMARLNADPLFVARRARAEEEHQKLESELRRAEAPLLEALSRAGIEVATVWDLVNTAPSYTAVLPLLLEHLQRTYPAPVRDGIARALAVPQARFALGLLTALYRKEREARPKDGLAAAIGAIAEDDDINDLLTLLREPENGPSRLLLLSALERSRSPRASPRTARIASPPGSDADPK